MPVPMLIDDDNAEIFFFADADADADADATNFFCQC